MKYGVIPSDEKIYEKGKGCPIVAEMKPAPMETSGIEIKGILP